MDRNTLRKIREGFLMSKAELARKAGVSPQTIDRIEKGKPWQVATQRKIILALGYDLSNKDKIFPEHGQRTSAIYRGATKPFNSLDM